MDEHDAFILQPTTYIQNKHSFPIANEKDELKLLSSLNTLRYVEFDTLCALSSLENKFKYGELSWLSRYTDHFIGKYYYKGEYMVHRVYFCLNLKCTFVVQQYDQLEGCNRYNYVMSRSPNFVIRTQVNFQEGDQSWLLPITCSSTKLKPRTACYQEGEDDEDMTPSDITIEYKVSSSLHLYNDFCYNSLGSTCTCHYLHVGTNVSQSARSLKMNFHFASGSIVLYWEAITHQSGVRPMSMST